MNTVVRLDKNETKIAQFIQRAQSTDESRPILNGINVNGSVVAVDGFRLHAVSTETLYPFADLAGKTVDVGKIRSGDNLLEAEEIEGNYPDWQQILPTTEPVVKIQVDPAFLVDACKTLDKGEAITVVIHDNLSPFEIHGTINGEPVYAMIMPMNDPKKLDNNWRPGR